MRQRERVWYCLHYCIIHTKTSWGPRLLTINMSNEMPSDYTRICKIAGHFKRKLFSFLHLSQAPTQSSMDMSSNSDNSTKCVTGPFHWLLFNNSLLLSILPPNTHPVVGVNHLPTTVFAATEASTVSPPASAPVSLLIPAAPKQLASTPRPETSPTVSDHAVLMIITANY